MRTITTNLYSFLELSKEAQAVAIENNRTVNTEYQEWYEGVYNNFEETNKDFNIDRIHFTGFSSQGDGAMFEYNGISKKLFHKAIDSLDIQNWKKKFIKDNCEINARGEHYGRYYHEKSCSHFIELSEEIRIQMKYHNIDLFLMDVEFKIDEYITKEYERLAQDLYRQLEKEYYNIQSDESVKDTLIMNDWEYLETGRNY